MLEKYFIGKGQVAGFKFEQVHADANWYIYRVGSYGSEWYEVFKRMPFYKSGTEMYPKDKVFGLTAWSVATLARAVAKIEEKSRREDKSKGEGRSSTRRQSGLILRKRIVKNSNE